MGTTQIKRDPGGNGCTLYDLLIQYGFTDACLDEDGQCKIDATRDPATGAFETTLEPAKKSVGGRVIRLSEFLRLGDLLMFSNEMKSDVPQALSFTSFLEELPRRPIHALFRVVVWAVASISGKLDELKHQSMIETWIRSETNPPFSRFPFDSWLRVEGIATTWLEVRDDNGQLWTVPTGALTDVRRIHFVRGGVGSK